MFAQLIQRRVMARLPRETHKKSAVVRSQTADSTTLDYNSMSSSSPLCSSSTLPSDETTTTRTTTALKEEKEKNTTRSSTSTSSTVIYFVRHAEATHNIKEREAIQQAIINGIVEYDLQQQARQAILHDESLRDAPLSTNGESQVKTAGTKLQVLNGYARYPHPKLVLVSPLRRALMTASVLFGTSSTDDEDDHNDSTTNSDHGLSNENDNNKEDDEEDPWTRKKNPPQGNTTTTASLLPLPRQPLQKINIVALEALREKRTGYAADERSSVAVLEQDFPEIDFSDLRQPLPPTATTVGGVVGPPRDETPVGEANTDVRERVRAFLEGPCFTQCASSQHHYDAIAIVSHKGWLREMRLVLKEWVDQGRIQKVDFDIDAWDQTLFGNAEIRVAEFGWSTTTTTSDNEEEGGGGTTTSIALTSIVSKSLEHALATVVLGGETTTTHGKMGDDNGDGRMTKDVVQRRLSSIQNMEYYHHIHQHHHATTASNAPPPPPPAHYDDAP
jgi:broad specificity phosphatase PhoE